MKCGEAHKIWIQTTKSLATIKRTERKGMGRYKAFIINLFLAARAKTQQHGF
jgi:hypothetical protein